MKSSYLYAAVAVLCGSASANAADGPDIKLSGFGTLAAAHSSEGRADFTALGDQPNGAGHTSSWALNTDSKLGVQADSQLSDVFSATAQLLVRTRYDNRTVPDLSMAFLKWQATPSVVLRGGRLPLPTFLISDSRNVGYSQTSVRPPVDLYRLFTSSTIDGADATWSVAVGDVAIKSQAFLGRIKAKQPANTFESRSAFGFNVVAEKGDLSLRAGYLGLNRTSLTSPELDGLFMGVRYGFPAGALGAGSPAIAGNPALADKYEYKGKSSAYTSLGLSYDPGKWFVTAEVGTLSAAGFIAKSTMGYVTAGVRWKALTPYAMVSRVKPGDASTTGNPVLDGLLAATSSVGQRTTSLGLRWDAMKNLALKTQFDRVTPAAGTAGQLINLQPGYVPGRSYGVFTVAADFVF